MRTTYDSPSADRPPHWSAEAACTNEDPDLFFPPSFKGVDALTANQAKAVCRTCPVVHDCLDAALERGETHGVFGALDPIERKNLIRPGRSPDKAPDVPA